MHVVMHLCLCLVFWVSSEAARDARMPALNDLHTNAVHRSVERNSATTRTAAEKGDSETGFVEQLEAGQTRETRGEMGETQGNSFVKPNPLGASSQRIWSDETNWYPCGDGMCQCKDTFAYCGKKILHYIPALPSGITSVDLTESSDVYHGLNITGDFFANITNITALCLSNNIIWDVSSDAFSFLPELTYLNLTKSMVFTCHDFSVFQQIQTLETLIMKDFLAAECDHFGDTDLQTPMPRLKELDLSSNLYRSVNTTYLSLLTGLKRLHLNSLQNMKMATFHSIVQQLRRLSSLIYLDLSCNPLSCDVISAALSIPCLEVLVLEGLQKCDEFPDVKMSPDVRAENFIPALTELYLSQSSFFHFDLTRLSAFTELKRLYVVNVIQRSFKKRAVRKRSSAKRLSELNSFGNRSVVGHVLTALDKRPRKRSSEDPLPDLNKSVSKHSGKDIFTADLNDRSVSCSAKHRFHTDFGKRCGIHAGKDVFPADLDKRLGKRFRRGTLEKEIFHTDLSSSGGRLGKDSSITDVPSSNEHLSFLRFPRQSAREPVLTDEGTGGITNFESLHQLTNLTILDLSENALTCEDLRTVLSILSLQQFVARRGITCKRPELDLLTGNGTRLVTLDLSLNDFYLVSFSSESQYDFDLMPCLSDDGSPIIPSLLYIDLSESSISHIYFFDQNPTCLPRRTSLNVRGNRLGTTYVAVQDYAYFRFLETLDISKQTYSGSQLIYNNTFDSRVLKSLDLSADNIDFGDESRVGLDSFAMCPNLESLILASTDFRGVTEKRFQELFGRSAKLKNFSLRSTGLAYITVGMFRGLISLQDLDLSHNDLVSLPNAAFQLLYNLVSVNLASNKITVVGETVFPPATRQQLHSIDLRFNPFTCSCDVLPFKRWLLSSNVFAGTLQEYTCANMPLDTSYSIHVPYRVSGFSPGDPTRHVNVPIASFSMVEQACLLSPQTSKFIVATISLILLGTSLLVFLYRYRWHIRLVLFEARRGPDARQRYLQEHRFEYDVFVAYDKDDFFWIRDHLQPNLERGMGLRLCLHQRDFLLGCPIVENIEKSVMASKKLLMIFSRAFAKSPWCQFELQLCLTHTMATQDVLMVVLLEDIPPREITPAMMAVMKTTTYIEWADEAEARDFFWRRMGLALHEILPVA